LIQSLVNDESGSVLPSHSKLLKSLTGSSMLRSHISRNVRSTINFYCSVDIELWFEIKVFIAFEPSRYGSQLIRCTPLSRVRQRLEKNLLIFHLSALSFYLLRDIVICNLSFNCFTFSIALACGAGQVVSLCLSVSDLRWPRGFEFVLRRCRADKDI
jgi:predicted permease